VVSSGTHTSSPSIRYSVESTPSAMRFLSWSPVPTSRKMWPGASTSFVGTPTLPSSDASSTVVSSQSPLRRSSVWYG
jgi:hypothetical protein